MDNEFKQADYIKNAYKIRITHMVGYESANEIHYRPVSIICEAHMLNDSSMNIYDKERNMSIVFSVSGINEGIRCKSAISDADKENIDNIEFDIKFAKKYLYKYSHNHEYEAVEFRLLLESDDIKDFTIEKQDPDVVGEPSYYFNFQPDITKQGYFSLCEKGCFSEGLRYNYDGTCGEYDVHDISENAKQRLKEKFVKVLNEVCYQEQHGLVFGDYDINVRLKNNNNLDISYRMICYDKYSWDDFVKEQIEFIEWHFKKPIDLKGHIVMYAENGYAYDAVESTEEYLAVAKSIEKKAREMDELHTFESENKIKQRLLKEIGIDWLTPEECNPPKPYSFGKQSPYCGKEIN